MDPISQDPFAAASAPSRTTQFVSKLNMRVHDTIIYFYRTVHAISWIPRAALRRRTTETFSQRTASGGSLHRKSVLPQILLLASQFNFFPRPIAAFYPLKILDTEKEKFSPPICSCDLKDSKLFLLFLSRFFFFFLCLQNAKIWRDWKRSKLKVSGAYLCQIIESYAPCYKFLKMT